MRLYILLIPFLCLTSLSALSQTEFTLDPVQSMLMTGKGPGQDGSINPYFGEKCYAVVSNIGERSFSIRVQKDGVILKEIPIQKSEVKKVLLLSDHELYLDPNPEGIAKARVEYEQIEE